MYMKCEVIVKRSLAQMIGEGPYIGITRYMEEFLTETAVNGILCQYDVWSNVSPLWLGKG